ncbi:MAG: TNT domain-containing protein [Solirubrobacterales bacterium]
MKDYILDSELLSEKTTRAYNILSDIIPLLDKIEETSQKAFAEINAHDELGYEDYTSIKSNINHIEEYRDKYKVFGAIGDGGGSYNYKCKDMTGVCYNGFIGEYQSEVDDIFYYDQENTLKKLRDSKLQDIYVENNVGIISPAMAMGSKTATSIYKDKINILDLLGYGRVSIAMQKEYANMKAKIDEYNASLPEYSVEHTSKHLSDYIVEALFDPVAAEAIDKHIFDSEIDKQKIHNVDDYINKMVTSADFDFETNDEKVLSTLGYFVPVYGEYQILNEIIAGQNPISGKHYSIKDRLDMIAALGVGCAIGKACKVVFAEIAEGAGKAVDINTIKNKLSSGNLDDLYKYINDSSLKSINNDLIDKIFKNIDKSISNTIENVNLKKTIVEKALNDGSKIDTLVPASIDFLDETSGWIKWPPNDGFIPDLPKGNRPIKPLEVGQVIDRYGRETGNYVSPKYPTVTYEERALPYLKNPNAYHQYEIIKPIQGVEYGEIAKAFGQSGGGTQYILPESLKYYLENGYIREIFN